MPVKEKQELEARIALLNHFSSKSSNQATNGLTVALSFFAFVTAIEPLKNLFGEGSVLSLNLLPSQLLCNILIVFILSSLIALGFHTVLRVLYWGELASLIMICEMASEERISELWDARADDPNFIKTKLSDKMKSFGYSENRSPSLVSWYMERLAVGCHDLYASKYLTEPEPPYKKRKWRFRNRRWTVIVFLASFVISFTMYDQTVRGIYLVIIILVAGGLFWFFGSTDTGRKFIRSIRRSGESKNNSANSK